MTRCWLDASSGVSGDKLLAALLDLGQARGGFALDDVRVAVESLGAGEARLEAERVTRGGIAGMHVRVTAAGDGPARRWREVRAMLSAAELPGAAAERAIAAFAAIALAEARVHGCEPDDVHFHEVAATDSIVDVVGVSVGLELLGIEGWVLSPVAVGGGTVTTAHGTLPVPAPATLELLEGVPVVTGGPSDGDAALLGELTTPTGAALATVNATGLGPIGDGVPLAVGYGAGTREVPGLPNVLRLVLTDAEALGLEPVVLLETNLDHLSPEHAAFVAEELRSADALDVWLTPIVMKKGRVGVLLSVLCSPGQAEALTSAIHDLSGTLGVRRTELSRHVAPREQLEVDTPWGPARVKVGAGRLRPEHDDVARIARDNALPYGFVRDEIARLASAQPVGPDAPASGTA